MIKLIIGNYTDFGTGPPDLLYHKHTPPEALFTRDFTTHFDIYQAGLTMYRMCVGSKHFNDQFKSYISPVFDRNRFAHDLNNGTFPDRNAIPIHIHSKVKKAILKCLAVNPDDRFQSALDILNAISDVDDNYLDWNFELDEDIRKWSKTSSTGVLHCIEVDGNGVSSAFKIGNTGNRTNTAAYTKANLSNRDLNNFFKQKR